MGEFGYSSAIHTPVRIHKKAKTCIDHIFMYSRKKYLHNITYYSSNLNNRSLYNNGSNFHKQRKQKINTYFTVIKKYFERINECMLEKLLLDVEWNDVISQQSDLDTMLPKNLYQK